MFQVLLYENKYLNIFIWLGGHFLPCYIWSLQWDLQQGGPAAILDHQPQDDQQLQEIWTLLTPDPWTLEEAVLNY